MSRTRRGIPHKHYWSGTEKEQIEHLERAKMRGPYSDSPKAKHSHEIWIQAIERDYLLRGTESRNYTVSSRPYFNIVNRVGRRVERDQLRPHKVLSEDFYFDDSKYQAKYKGIWWEIY